MTDSAPAETLPVAIERVERSRGDETGIRLRLSGRWLGPGDPADLDPLLVVTVDQRRHRFPADRGPRAGLPLPAGRWEAVFDLPAWAEPARPGQAALWVGDRVVPVPPPGVAFDRPRPPAGGSVGAEPDPGLDTGPARSGPAPPSEQTVTALHAELEQRAAEAARLRGELAAARADLDSRTARQTSLESAQADLRTQLHQLTEAAAGQRQQFDRRTAGLQERLTQAEGRQAQADRARADAEAGRDRYAAEVSALRQQLAAAGAAREAAAGEVAGLQAELQRLGSELAVTHEHLEARGGDLGEAQRLLADARALTEQLRGEIPQ